MTLRLHCEEYCKVNKEERQLMQITTALMLLKSSYQLWSELKHSDSAFLRRGALKNKCLGLKIHDRYLNGQRLYGTHWHN